MKFQNYHQEFEEIFLVKTEPKMSYFSSTHPKRVTLKPGLEYVEFLKLHDLSAKDHLDRPWIKNLEMDESDLEGELVFPVLIGFHADDESVHILQGSLSAKTIFERIKSVPVGGKPQDQHRMILIFDEFGNLIFHPNEEKPDFKKWGKVLREIKNQTLDHHTQSTMHYFATHREIQTLGWQILVLFDRNEALKEMQSLKLRILIIFIIATLLSILFARILGPRFSDPLLRLKKSASMIENGNFDIDPKVHTGDEIEDLSQSILAMASSLKENQEDLESSRIKLEETALVLETRVQERTRNYLLLAEEYKSIVTLLSHDLGNYLNSLSLEIRELNSSTPLSEVEPKIHQVQSLVQDINRLFLKIRELRALQEGHLDMKPESIPVVELFEDMEILFSQRLKQKNLKLGFLSPEDLMVWADREWLSMSVLANLISNAIKFSSPGGKIDLRCQKMEDKVELIVFDEGRGVSKKELETLFDPSNRSPQKGTQGEKGTGFGLILARKFIEEMQGAISIESQEATVSKSGFFKATVVLPAG